MNRTHPRSGFTLLELMLVISLIGTLASIAAPQLRDAVYRADAAKVVSDVDALQTAAYQYLEEHGAFPPTQPWAMVPAELEAYLPDGLPFTYKDVEYRWQRRQRGRVVRILVRYPRDSMLGDALRSFASDDVAWGRRKTTFTIVD